MPEEALDVHDKAQIYIRRFDQRLREELRELVTSHVIEEHRRGLVGRPSEALQRLTNYFRSAAIADKYALVCNKPFAEYRIIALSGRRGVAPRVVDDRVFTSWEEAMHAVFLKRVQDLLES